MTLFSLLSSKLYFFSDSDNYKDNDNDNGNGS